MKPEMMYGSPWHEEYLAIARIRKTSPTCSPRRREMDRGLKELPAEAIPGIEAPTLIVIGDSDLVRPEHAVEMFRLLGGGVIGDLPAGLRTHSSPSCREPLTSRCVSRADLLLPMITSFLDAPHAGCHVMAG